MKFNNQPVRTTLSILAVVAISLTLTACEECEEINVSAYEDEITAEEQAQVDDNGYFEIQSNDPVTPVETSAQVGEGAYESITIDSFEQDGMMGSDILFVIDNSGSMCGNQTQLANNFDTFIT